MFLFVDDTTVLIMTIISSKVVVVATLIIHDCKLYWLHLCYLLLYLSQANSPLPRSISTLDIFVPRREAKGAVCRMQIPRNYRLRRSHAGKVSNRPFPV